MTINIKDIILNGTNSEKLAVFAFNENTEIEKIYRKFNYFSRSQYPRYFKSKSALFHKDMVIKYINAYKGNKNFLNLAFRGSAKTTLLKLLLVFVILNDEDKFRKYMKVLTRDLKNAKQIVTDVYNLIVEVKPIYGTVFETNKDIKREETMSSFTLASGVKLSAGTVGQTQRGHIQDAYRPDFIWFDDIEDSESIMSQVVTDAIIRKVDEAIQGLSIDGTYVCTANYISDIGVIENIKSKNVDIMVIPIIDSESNPAWDYFTKEKVESIKNDAEDWWGEYMCDPITGSKREFRKELFRYIEMEQVLLKETRIFLTIDPAVSKADNADFTGFTLNFVDGENKWYFKAWREKLNSGELFNKLFQLWDYWSPKGLETIGIEETAFTIALKPFLDDEMNKRNIFMHIVPLKHGGIKKEIRIRGLLNRYEAGNIYHIKNECDDLEGELLRFPLSKHDDTSDSSAYQDQIAQKPHPKDPFDEYWEEEEPLYSSIGM